MRTMLLGMLLSMVFLNLHAQSTGNKQTDYKELYRPQLHFSPRAHWMNDPNGMVFYKGVYHLFFQYYPDSTVWGPMHWGHAITKDLVHWKELPIALYPDSIGYIFSGSAFVDSFNTSGFGKGSKAPLVAIFTQHDIAGEKANTDTFQTQSIAYSNDEGKTWIKYASNPVLRNPGIRDFRDPKVMWHAESKKWIMTLATKDRITFYSSKNLKYWNRESEFGAAVGAHGGVWECPDLFMLNYGKEKIWILTVSINPGGPNGGSATQYFVGKFDGHEFTSNQTDTRWIDWGTDNYAGVTWSNTGKRKIFLGWMSNWNYAQVVPTSPWRSAMTIPRYLALQKVGEKYYVVSQPTPELFAKAAQPTILTNVVANNTEITNRIGKLNGPSLFKMSSARLASFSITFYNAANEKLLFGFDKEKSEYYIDRIEAGQSGFNNGFAARHTGPRISKAFGSDITIVLDAASIEVFADGGLTTMTDIFFPTEPYTNVLLQSPSNMMFVHIQYQALKSIWK